MKAGHVIALGAAVFLLLAIPSPAKASTKSSKRHEDYFSGLDPEVVNDFREFISDVEAMGYKVAITSGRRSRKRQAELHKEDSRNAKPGSSTHEYGKALDIVLYKNGNVIDKSSTADEWKRTGVVRLAKNKYGMNWGGDFLGYFDPVHFYYSL